MNIVIAGGHGKIALLLGQLLSEAGNEARGLIRNPDHAADLEARGITPVVCDLEREDADLTGPLEGAGAAVFAAGAGPGSGEARKRTMDRDGAIRLIEACQSAGVRRYVIVSAMGARRGVARGEGGFGAYLEAKAQADEALRTSGLDYTIVRPGALTDEPPTGQVAIDDKLPRSSIPRADVAQTLVVVLASPNTVGAEFDLTSGTVPIQAAVASL
jgi:uncharacterized protein YbjT (DUF2867 family)